MTKIVLMKTNVFAEIKMLSVDVFFSSGFALILHTQTFSKMKKFDFNKNKNVVAIFTFILRENDFRQRERETEKEQVSKWLSSDQLSY